MADKPKLNKFELAAFIKITGILKHGKPAPDGTLYISPLITVEVGGRSQSVQTGCLIKLAGWEPVPGKLNYYRRAERERTTS